MSGQKDLGRVRDGLVDHLRAAGVVRTERVERALRSVPRHVFVPQMEPEQAYRDEAVITKWTADGRPISSSSQPRVMAVMLEQLQVLDGARVLEIGTGTGYNAALLAYLVGETGQVTTVDIDDDLVDQARRHLAAADVSGVSVVCADGAAGWPAAAPYDRIMLTVGAWDVAAAWVDQLTSGGRLVLPLSLRGVQRCVAFARTGEYLTSVSVAPCGFMPLRGQMTGPQSIHPLGDQPGLFLQCEGQRTPDTAALYTALHAPAELLATGIRVTPREVFDGLALWLALHQPDLGQLSAIGAVAQRGLVPPLLSFPGNIGTGVLLGEQAMAALVRLNQQHGDDRGSTTFELGVRAFGTGGHPLAHRLRAAVQQWHESGRPATAGLRIRAYPPGHPTDEEHSAAIIDKQHSRVVLDWPPQPHHHST
jgi:protein-L-isoaspartate(D-aspartate) O-methyltransferase